MLQRKYRKCIWLLEHGGIGLMVYVWGWAGGGGKKKEMKTIFRMNELFQGECKKEKERRSGIEKGR